MDNLPMDNQRLEVVIRIDLAHVVELRERLRRAEGMLRRIAAIEDERDQMRQLKRAIRMIGPAPASADREDETLTAMS